MTTAVESSAAGSNENPQPPKSKALISSSPNRFWTAIRRLLPSHVFSNLLPRISNLYPRGSSAKTRRRKPGLPLPLPPKILKSRRDVGESSRVICILEDIFERVISSLHAIQKNLQFWQSRAEGTDTQKLYFMFFERGPRAFIDETINLISRHRREGLSMDILCDSAAATISERIDVLLTLQRCLARFLAQIYMEVDKCGELLITDLDKSLPSLLVTIDSLFSKLEESMSLLPEVYKSDDSFFTDGDNSRALMFVKLHESHETDHERSQWTDIETVNATKLIYQNLQRLDAFVDFLVSKYKKPTRLTLYWVHYTCGTVGLSICMIWLIRHSSLMGSSDIDNWIREAKESTTGFWSTHVEEPLLSIRDELFETFKRREKGVMEPEEVQLTADSLHRMLLAFAEQAKGQKLLEDLSDQTMMEIVMSRYEKELTHPISSLVSGGELVRALLIQVQKLKLDLEMAMLDLNKILKANEINFAILAALPAFFLFFLLLMLARALVQQIKGKGAEGRGRIARRQRRLLVGEVKLWIIKFQTCLDEGREEDAQYMYGLVLYCLDRLCKAVEGHARETGEWLSLRQDIYEIASCGLKTDYKLQVISDIKDYDCMLPAYQRH